MYFTMSLHYLDVYDYPSGRPTGTTPTPVYNCSIKEFGLTQGLYYKTYQINNLQEMNGFRCMVASYAVDKPH
jgi:hypothetical protein